MALISHRINLTSASFPLLSELLGRTVIIRGSDQNSPQTIQTGVAPDPAQLYYAHNVLPTAQGYQSIGYLPFIPAVSGVFNFKYIFNVTDSSGSLALLGFTDTGAIYRFRFGDSAWFQLASIPGYSNQTITTAYVKGVTYIYFYALGCYKYNFTLGTLDPVTLSGLNAATIYGIAGASGYLVAYGVSNSVAWSSQIDPTDFVPSLATGAGGGVIEGAQGDTTLGITVYGGIIFLTKKNAVAAIYQANNRFPFQFVQVVGSGGLSATTLAAGSALDSPNAFAYTTSGLQNIDVKQAHFLLPEVTEFLSGSRIEDFNQNTLQFSITTPATAIKKQLAWVADRYLVISYGASALNYALVYDSMLQRLGKLKIDHVACFEFNLYDQTIYETPKKSIGILKADGSVSVVNTDISDASSDGVALLGKYQYVRSHYIQLQGVEFENLNAINSFVLYDLPTLDGKTFESPVTGTLNGYNPAGLTQAFRFHNTAVNHSLLAIGRFNLVSGELQFNISGRYNGPRL